VASEQDSADGKSRALPSLRHCRTAQLLLLADAESVEAYCVDNAKASRCQPSYRCSKLYLSKVRVGRVQRMQRKTRRFMLLFD
jgi:hypothetical protein